MNKFTRFADSIPLIRKMTAITVLVGVIAWGVADYLQSSYQKEIFDAFMSEQLVEQSRRSRVRFDEHVAKYYEALKLVTSQKKFLDYVSAPAFSVKSHPATRQYTDIPPWLPDSSVMRRFVPITYAVLGNGHGTVIEIYNGGPADAFPQSLLMLPDVTASLSHGQSYMTTVDNLPFLLSSITVDGQRGNKLADLLLAAPIDDDFMAAAEGLHSNVITALASADTPRLIASSRPEVLPSGVLLSDITKDYVITGKSFFDRGASDLTLQFLTLIPKKQFDALGASLLRTERIQRAITAVVIIGCLALIMLWITRHIRGLTKDIIRFSDEYLGTKTQETLSGDELRILEKRFGRLTEEILEARELIRRQAEMLLREKTVYLDSIMNSSTLAIAATDLEFRLKYFNPAAERFFGYRAEEVIGKTVLEIPIMEKVDPARFEQAIEIVKRENLYVYKVQARTSEGLRFLESRVSGIWDKTGELVGFVLMSTDVTERTNFERRLAAQYTVTRILAEAATVGEAVPRLLQEVCESIGWEFGEMWRANESAEQLVWAGCWHVPGMDAEAFKMCSADMTFSLGVGLPGRVWKDAKPVWVQDVVKDGNFPRGPLALAAGLHGAFAFPLKSEGEVVGVLAFFSRHIQDPDNELLLMLDAIGSQIGGFIERKKSEEQLKVYSTELERSNQELQLFASTTSHDLQEPLRVTAGFAQLLARRYGDRLDEEAHEFISYIVDGTTRMRQMIKDLLDYSRVTTKGKPFEPVNCEQLLKTALENLALAIEESGARVTSGPLPVLMADSSQLVRLFQNLIGNAVKYRGAEPPLVRVAAGKKDGQWVFSVSDNGIGIEPRHFERIFGIFQRLHGRQEYSGTGIGLAVCKRIVERHRGRIWVESEPGKGSVFYFTIPDSHAQEAPVSTITQIN